MRSIRSMAAAASIAFILPSFVPMAGAQLRPELTITASSSSAGSFPMGAQRVEFLRLKLTASCASDIRISELTVTHAGLGLFRDIEGLSLWLNGRRLSRVVAMESKSGRAVLRPREFTVPKCSTVEAKILGDIAEDASAGGEHQFFIAGADGISTSPDASVRVITGSSSLRSVTPTVPASVSVEMLSLNGALTYGGGRTVARFRISSEGVRDQRITRITLTNDGSAANTDLQNLRFVSSRGEVLSAVLPSLDGSTASFVIDPPLVLRGSEERVLQMRADIRASRHRTVDFMIEEPSDIEAEACTGARGCAQAH